jgi:hypothetical protein
MPLEQFELPLFWLLTGTRKPEIATKWDADFAEQVACSRTVNLSRKEPELFGV